MEKIKSWDETFLKIASTFASRSTCIKRQVGAVLVKDLRILSTGYNGTPSGFFNCEDVFKDKDLNKGVINRGWYDSFQGIDHVNRECINHHDFSEKYEIHAEQNCIAFAARNGVSTGDCTLYVTTAPCVHCAKLIIAAGIKRVVYKDDYKSSSGVELLKEAEIPVLHLN